MSSFKAVLGAVAGVAAALVAVRTHAVARERDQPVADVMTDLPGILGEDLTRIADAARHAIEDGRAAADRARIEFDEQVAAGARRTKGEHG